MRIGTFLPTYWTNYGSAGRRTAIEETAKAAQALGYESLWANDHIIAPATQAPMGYIIEPLITLASLVHLVPEVRLGTSTLVLPQRNAILVAKQVAALDVLSGGRVILGIGAGWLAEEFAFLGADFAQRGAVTDEAIGVLRALWNDTPASFHGRFYDFADAVCEPRPTGPIPLWLCGSAPAMLRRAARFGNAWNPFGPSLPAYTAGVATLRRAADERMPLLSAHLRIRIGDTAHPNAHVAGTAEEVAAALHGYREAGMAYLICDFVADGLGDLLEQMQVMAERIAPQLVAAL